MSDALFTASVLFTGDNFLLSFFWLALLVTSYVFLKIFFFRQFFFLANVVAHHQCFSNKLFLASNRYHWHRIVWWPFFLSDNCYTLWAFLVFLWLSCPEHFFLADNHCVLCEILLSGSHHVLWAFFAFWQSSGPLIIFPFWRPLCTLSNILLFWQLQCHILIFILWQPLWPLTLTILTSLTTLYICFSLNGSVERNIEDWLSLRHEESLWEIYISFVIIYFVSSNNQLTVIFSESLKVLCWWHFLRACFI